MEVLIFYQFLLSLSQDDDRILTLYFFHDNQMRTVNQLFIVNSSFLNQLIKMKNVYQFSKQPMRKLTNLFRMTFCTLKQPGKIQPLILLNNFPARIDPVNNILITEDLKGVISDFLKKPYLGVCQKSHEEIKKQTKFQGINYGDGFRMFITMPTRPNIHSPMFIIFSIQAHLSQHQPTKRYVRSMEKNILSIRHLTQATIQLDHPTLKVHLSNPNPGIKDTIYHNFNVLGRNFYRQFKKVQIIENVQEEYFEMIVQK